MDIDASSPTCRSAPAAIVAQQEREERPLQRRDHLPERTQMLAGNRSWKAHHIDPGATAPTRTRAEETRDLNGNVESIHINDAVDSARITLTPSAKTAHQIHDGSGLRKRIENSRSGQSRWSRSGSNDH